MPARRSSLCGNQPVMVEYGPPIHGDDSSEASQDSFVELEKDWHLEVAKEVASTIHTRSTVKRKLSRREHRGLVPL